MRPFSDDPLTPQPVSASFAHRLLMLQLGGASFSDGLLMPQPISVFFADRLLMLQLDGTSSLIVFGPPYLNGVLCLKAANATARRRFRRRGNASSYPAYALVC